MQVLLPGALGVGGVVWAAYYTAHHMGQVRVPVRGRLGCGAGERHTHGIAVGGWGAGPAPLVLSTRGSSVSFASLKCAKACGRSRTRNLWV